MAPIHIDETSGSDDTGKGTQEVPYKSLGQALFNHGPTSSYLFRKDQTVKYDEPTQSSLKKAKKTADGIEKKKKKQEELAERDAKEKGEEHEKRERLLEESKKIILEEDISLPKATKVSLFFFFFLLKTVLTEMIIPFISRKLYISLIYGQNEFVYSDGFIVYDNKKI